MCGIWARLGRTVDNESVEYWVQRLRGRGPEGMSIKECDGGAVLGFTRLAINGLVSSGMQPMSFGSLTFMCNGEIYNWKDLAERHGIVVESGSDCEILGELWEKFATYDSGATFFQALDGVFSVVIVDSSSKIAYVARDPYGVRPLFVGYKFGVAVNGNEPLSNDVSYVTNSQGQTVPVENIYFGSEMKSIQMCDHIEAFPPGHCAAYDMKTLKRIGFQPYHSIPWLKNPLLSDIRYAMKSLRYALEAAVEKRMMTERPVAALLSGGLDSSLIAAIVQEKLGASRKLKTFSIGFAGSSDLEHARLVAEHIGSDHTEVIMTPEEFLEAIPDVIGDIESYDITTVRASVGNWLLSKYIAKHSDCKVVFNGDGSDEVFGGYLYFYNAPSDEAFEEESGRLLRDMHNFDVLRSDRSISSHGLEARTPFLDKQFVAVARSISTKLRRPVLGVQVEKWILRKAFEDSGLLPNPVLWRRKEAFSDGVSGTSKPWYKICQESAEKIIEEENAISWKSKAESISHLTPQTAEAYYYRWIFHKKFGKKFDSVTVPYHWMPKWSVGATDPSARTLTIY
jgi:asparagine synthase (glutamine-hydrolysing)